MFAAYFPLFFLHLQTDLYPAGFIAFFALLAAGTHAFYMYLIDDQTLLHQKDGYVFSTLFL